MSDIEQLHQFTNKINLQLQQLSHDVDIKDQDHDAKIQLLWTKVGANQLQGGYKNQTDLLNYLFIQLQLQINKVNQIQNKLGTSEMDKSTFSDSINDLRTEIVSYQEQLYNLAQQISPLDEIKELKQLAASFPSFEQFKEQIKQVNIQRKQSEYHIHAGEYNYGVYDNIIYIEKVNINSFDVRYCYDIVEDRCFIQLDVEPIVQKQYKVEDIMNIKYKDAVIGGKFNQPIIINTGDRLQTIENRSFNGVMFNGRFLIKNCTLKNCIIKSLEEVEIRQCLISQCKIDVYGINIQASNILLTKITSHKDISINTYQPDQYHELRYMRQTEVLAYDQSKITIQSNENQYGLWINDCKFHIINNTQNKNGLIAFIGSKFFIKNSQFYIVKNDGSIARGVIQYNFSQKVNNMNMKSVVLKAEDIEFVTSNKNARNKLILNDSNIICQKYNIQTSLDTDMINQVQLQ